MFLNLFTLLAFTQSVDDVLRLITVLCENGHFLICNLHCSFTTVPSSSRVLIYFLLGPTPLEVPERTVLTGNHAGWWGEGGGTVARKGRTRGKNAANWTSENGPKWHMSVFLCHRNVLSLLLQEDVLSDTVATDDGLPVERVCRRPRFVGGPCSRGMGRDGRWQLLSTQSQDVQHQEAGIQLQMGRASEVRRHINVTVT